jgi:hypothetical protein
MADDKKPMDRKSRAKRKAARAKRRAHKASKKASSQKRDTIVELNLDSLFDQEATMYLHGLFMPNPPPRASIAATIMPATPKPVVAGGPSTLSPSWTPTPASFTAAHFNPTYNPGFAGTPSLYEHNPTAYAAGTSAPSLFSDVSQQQQPKPEIDIGTEFPQMLNSHLNVINQAKKFHAHQRRKLILDSGNLSASAMDETTRRNAFDYQNEFFTKIKSSTSLPTSKKKYFENVQPFIYTQWKSDSDPEVNLPEPKLYKTSDRIQDLKNVASSHFITLKTSLNKSEILQTLYDNGIDAEVPSSSSSGGAAGSSQI